MGALTQCRRHFFDAAGGSLERDDEGTDVLGISEARAEAIRYAASASRSTQTGGATPSTLRCRAKVHTVYIFYSNDFHPGGNAQRENDDQGLGPVDVSDALSN